MFGHKTHGPAGGGEVTRREFFGRAAMFLGAIPILGVFGHSLLNLRNSFYQKAALRRNLANSPISVYKMVPLPGIKYGKAELGHMANKIFPSIADAQARRPHGGFLYGLKAIPLSASLVSGLDQYTLFCNRKDFDRRVLTDRHHWQRLGVDMNAVFGVVKNA